MTKIELKTLKKRVFVVIIILAIYGLGKIAKLILEYFGFLQEVSI